MRKVCCLVLAVFLLPAGLVAQFVTGPTGVVGGKTPMDAAREMAGHRLDGDWKNVDERTRGIVRVVIQRSLVHPYGSCHPTACDWGELQGQPFAPKVDKPGVSALLVSYDTRAISVILTVSLDPDGRLRVQTFNHFADGSRRADYTAVDYFTR